MPCLVVLLYCCVLVVYTVSLRQQLQDVSKKLVGALHYNKDGSVNNRQEFFFLAEFIFSCHLFIVLLYVATSEESIPLVHICFV